MIALTPREHDALSAYVMGTGTRAAAADDAGMSRATMNQHLRHVYEKADAWSTLSALFKMGWITIPERPVVLARYAAPGIRSAARRAKLA